MQHKRFVTPSFVGIFGPWLKLQLPLQTGFWNKGNTLSATVFLYLCPQSLPLYSVRHPGLARHIVQGVSLLLKQSGSF